jgi:hypothetical protein
MCSAAHHDELADLGVHASVLDALARFQHASCTSGCRHAVGGRRTLLQVALYMQRIEADVLSDLVLQTTALLLPPARGFLWDWAKLFRVQHLPAGRLYRLGPHLFCLFAFCCFAYTNGATAR